MSIEGINTPKSGEYSREKYDDTEKEIQNIGHSVDAHTPLEEMRQKFDEQENLEAQKQSLHNEAWDQAKVEDEARNEVATVQQDADAQERTALLQKMQEMAGIQPKMAEGESTEEPRKQEMTQENTAYESLGQENNEKRETVIAPQETIQEKAAPISQEVVREQPSAASEVIQKQESTGDQLLLPPEKAFKEELDSLSSGDKKYLAKRLKKSKSDLYDMPPNRRSMENISLLIEERYDNIATKVAVIGGVAIVPTMMAGIAAATSSFGVPVAVAGLSMGVTIPLVAAVGIGLAGVKLYKGFKQRKIKKQTAKMYGHA